MKVLVTGSAGFAGGKLMQQMFQMGDQPFGFDLREGHDVRDYEQVRTAVERYEPDLLFHLAAQAWARESVTDPARCMDVNVRGAVNVLEAVRHASPHTRVLLAGSSEEYGYAAGPSGVIDENTACTPRTPYGVSKLAATTLGMAYARQYGLNVVATRAFSHTGWGKPAVYAESAFARRIVAVERGTASEVEHGPLGSWRNFTHVADVIEAYRRAIMLPPGIYNVCSDDTVPMQQVMDTLVELSSAPEVKLTQVAGLGSPGEGRFPDPSHQRLTSASGWVPRTSLRETLAELLRYWRAQ